MKRLFLIILSLALILPLSAQNRNTTTRKATTATSKKTTTAKKTTSKNTQKKVDKKTLLKNEQALTQKKRIQSQAQLAQLNKSIKSNLDSVLILDNQIGKHQNSIDSLNHDIVNLGATIDTLSGQLTKLGKDLEVRKKNYSKALVYMRRTRSLQSKLMFILSANNFSQMMRRIRYMQEYSTLQRAQGELLKEKQNEVRQKQNELLSAKAQKESSLQQVEQKKKSLLGLKINCESKVDFLNKNIATVQQQIKEYQKKEASLNAEIDRIVQAEIEAARRAEAERKRKAEAEKREKARKLAEAKAAAERARRAEAEAIAARKAAKTEEEKATAKVAEAKAKEATKAAEAEVKVAAKEEKAERTKVEAWKSNDSGADAKLSSNFASNKGRLPMPITGSYSVVGHYGNYSVAGLKNVTLDNKGIDIRGQQGCQARAVFDGQVSSVFQYGGMYIVMLRHGSYISVYSGLSNVSVSKGQRVKTRDTLGAIGANADGNYVLQFQLRNESSRLNPEAWVR